MNNLQFLLEQGLLQDAKKEIIDKIKIEPKNALYRSYYIELLCIDGLYEKADEQLMQSIKIFPEYISGASKIRYLIKAAQARVDFSRGAATASFINDDIKNNKLMLEVNLTINKGSKYEIDNAVSNLEFKRKKKPFFINNKEYKDIRDIDDSLCGYIELFSQTGNYYLISIEDIQYLELLEPSNYLENIWRPVFFDIEGIGEGEAHMPLTYINSNTDKQKLAKETDWKKIGAERAYIGLGQKILLIDEATVNFFNLNKIKEYRNVL